MRAITPRYDDDFYAWTQHQAALLRTGKWQKLDYTNLAEEIESLGKRDRRELGSRLEILVMHLLKWHYQPQGRALGHSWYDTIVEQRRELSLLLEDSPSLRQQVPAILRQRYGHARRHALRETGLPDVTLPHTCPWDAAQLLHDDFWPEEDREEGAAPGL